jgi:hypothetical protein
MQGQRQCREREKMKMRHEAQKAETARVERRTQTLS